MRVPPPSRPEHTGENRCWPCTALNALLVGTVCIAVGRRRRGLAILGAVLGAAAIYDRGYVVPYTPLFAPRLAAALGVPSGRRGRSERAESGSLAATAGGANATPRADTGSSAGADADTRPDSEVDVDTDVDVEAGAGVDGRDGGRDDEPAGEELFDALLEAGVLVADGEAVALSPAVEERWERSMAELRALDDEALAAAALDASAASDAWPVADDSRATTVERRYIVLSDGSGLTSGETWLARPVAIAETAAVRALSGTVEDPATRRAAARAMRVFLEACPDCATPLRETTTAACCGGSAGSSTRPREVLACPECDVWLHLFE